MKLAHQAQRERQGTKPLDAVLEGDDVIGDLAQIGGASFDHRAGLGGKQLPERRLSPLNSARENRFPTHERTDQQMRVGQAAHLA